MTYKLTNSDSILIDWPYQLRDGVDKPELEAQVASNDYFALLATKLDGISQSLQKKHHSDYVVLEETIDDLLYLHKYYQIRKQ